MHELGIMCNVAERVLRVVRENGLTEVEAIVLQVGELSPVVPRYLETCYPAAVDGTMLESTELEIEVLPAEGRCRRCGEAFDVVENKGDCPGCGEKDFELLGGQEFCIKEIRAR